MRTEEITCDCCSRKDTGFLYPIHLVVKFGSRSRMDLDVCRDCYDRVKNFLMTDVNEIRKAGKP